MLKIASALNRVLILKVLSLLISTLLSIYLARALSTEDFGKIQIVLRTVDIGIVLSTLGFKELVVTYIQKAIGEGDQESIRGIISSTSVIVLLISLLLYVVFFVAFATYFSVIELLSLGLFFVAKSFIIIRAAHLLGLNKPVQAIFFSEILLNLLLFLIILLYENKLSSSDVVNYFSLLSATSTVALSLYTIKTIGLLKFEVQRELVVNLLKSSKYVLFVGFTGILVSNIDTIIVSRFFGFHNAAIYSIMIKIATLLSFPLISLNSYLAPYISKHHHGSQTAELNRLLYRSSIIATILSFIGFMTIVLFGKSILGLWGTDYTRGYYWLIVMGGAQFFNVVIGPAGLILNLCGMERVHWYLSLKVLILMVVMGLPLLHLYGLYGLIATMAFTVIFGNILKYVAVRSNLSYYSSFLLNSNVKDKR